MLKRLSLGLCLLLAIVSLSSCRERRVEKQVEKTEVAISEALAFQQSTESGKVEVTFLGRASLRIKTRNGLVIYIDPYAGMKKDYKESADLVLVTHQHLDHNVVKLVTLKQDGVVLNCPQNIRAGDSEIVKEINVQAVPAYNDNHDTSSCCGYILTIDDLVIYHSGDTSKIDEMAMLADAGIDYAFLCADGFYNMGPEEAMEVAEIIQAKHVIPIHTASEGYYDRKKDEAFQGENALHMKPGDTLVLEKNKKYQ